MRATHIHDARSSADKVCVWGGGGGGGGPLGLHKEKLKKRPQMVGSGGICGKRLIHDFLFNMFVTFQN